MSLIYWGGGRGGLGSNWKQLHQLVFSELKKVRTEKKKHILLRKTKKTLKHATLFFFLILFSSSVSEYWDYVRLNLQHLWWGSVEFICYKTSGFKPTYHIHYVSRVPWFQRINSTPSFNKSEPQIQHEFQCDSYQLSKGWN